MHLMLFLVTVALSPPPAAPAQDEKTAGRQPEVRKAEAPLVTRFYRLNELSDLADSFPFSGDVPATNRNALGQHAASTSTLVASRDQRGSVGLFSVPSPPQGGGLGGGGFGGGGGMSFGVNSGNKRSAVRYYDGTLGHVSNLLHTFVDPDEWKDNGGRAVMSVVSQSLLVRTTEAHHEHIRDFLNRMTDSIKGGRPVRIDAWWLPLNPGERRRLSEILETDWKDGAKAAEGITNLNELTESSGGYHGSLRSRSGRTAHITGGYHRPLVVGTTAVVGADAVGQTAIVKSVNYGIVFEITPRFISEWRDLGNKPAVKGRGGNEVALVVNTSLTGVGAQHGETATVSDGEVDRYDIGAQVLRAASVCKLGEPTVLGSLAAIGLPPVEGDDKNEIHVIIRVR